MPKRNPNKPKEYTLLENNYKLEVVRQDSILADIDFSDLEYDICKDVISILESKIAEVISSNKTASIPYIGRLRKPLVKQELFKQRNVLRVAKHIMDKKEFRQYSQELYRECADKIKDETLKNIIRRKLIAANRKRYTELYNKFGEFSAELWITSIMWMTPIEFNQEIQDAFDTIERNETTNRKVNNRR